jgi:hypothetical protein
MTQHKKGLGREVRIFLCSFLSNPRKTKTNEVNCRDLFVGFGKIIEGRTTLKF